MSQPFQFSQAQMDILLQMAGKRMGTDPNKLKEQMQSGQTDAILGALPKDKQAQIASLMQNPQAVEQLMQNPKVQQLIQGLMNK